MKKIFRSVVNSFKRGHVVRFHDDERLERRYIKRPECKEFHRIYGPIPKDILDNNGPSFRAAHLAKDKREPSVILKRIYPRRVERKECRAFHRLHRDFEYSELDNTGPDNRKGKFGSFYKLIGQFPDDKN